jgi:hypothetical protein
MAVAPAVAPELEAKPNTLQLETAVEDGVLNAKVACSGQVATDEYVCPTLC